MCTYLNWAKSNQMHSVSPSVGPGVHPLQSSGSGQDQLFFLLILGRNTMIEINWTQGPSIGLVLLQRYENWGQGYKNVVCDHPRPNIVKQLSSQRLKRLFNTTSKTELDGEELYSGTTAREDRRHCETWDSEVKKFWLQRLSLAVVGSKEELEVDFKN